MPRNTNPGAIATGPGKPVSTDMDQLVLQGMGGVPVGEGAYIPPGETSPRAGYPALPCRACGGAGGGVAPAGSVEETILTVGLPNINPAWTGFTTNYTTLADAVDAANTLMDADGVGNPGRAVRILVVGPTVETAVPIEIGKDGLIIEGYPGLEGTDAAITWATNDSLIDLRGHDDLVFRDLKFAWTGAILPPVPPSLRNLFTTSSSSKISRLTIDNCVCLGDIQGFLSPSLGGAGAGFEFASITRNNAQNLLEFGVLGFSTGDPPFAGSVIQDNVFLNTSVPLYSVPAIGLFGSSPSNSTIIRNNLINGFYQGISTLSAPSGTVTTEIDGNIIGGTQEEGIYIEGTANRVVGNTLLGVYTSGGGRGIFVDGDENVVTLNHVDMAIAGGDAIQIGSLGTNNVCSQNDVTEDTTGRITVEAALSVITGNKAKEIDSEGTHSTVSLNLISPGGGMEIQGSETTVQGNNIANDLFIRTSSCTVVGNQVSGNFEVTNEGFDNTIGDNHISGNLILGAACRGHTVSGNGIGGFVSELAGDNVFTGNDVDGDFTTIGDNCVIDGNRFNATAWIKGDGCTFTGNKNTSLMQIDGDLCTVSGNRGEGNLLITGQSVAVTGNWAAGSISTSSSFCTIGDNLAEQIVVNGPSSTIGDNVFGIDLQVGGADCTILGNRGGGGGPADILVMGPGCTLSGNNVVGAIDVRAINCAVSGNKCDVIFNAGGGPAPLPMTLVGNRYLNVLGLAPNPEFAGIANSTPGSAGNV